MHHATRIDLAENVRKPVIELLNARLAESIDLGLQVKQAHWNVKGPSFIALHELFDKLADEVQESIDEVAERVTALGGVALGTLQAVSSGTKLPAYSLTLKGGKDHLTALATAVALVGKNVRAAIDQSATLGDADTADLFTGYSRTLDKYLWFLEAHLQADN